MKTLIIALILYIIPKKIDRHDFNKCQMWQKKKKKLKRFSYVGVSPIPQINIHEFSLELSHLFGTTSFDSCFCSKPKFLLKTEKDANRTRYGCILFLNK